MEGVRPGAARPEVLEIFQYELRAEQALDSGDPRSGVGILQNLVDRIVLDSEEKGWYLQEMARYASNFDQIQSNKFQTSAFGHNRLLFKPLTGTPLVKLVVSQNRVEKIIRWIKKFPTHPALQIELNDILGRLNFGSGSEKFEKALDEVGKAIGLDCERPDKEWKAGPDNLWCLDSNRPVAKMRGFPRTG